MVGTEHGNAAVFRDVNTAVTSVVARPQIIAQAWQGQFCPVTYGATAMRTYMMSTTSDCLCPQRTRMSDKQESRSSTCPL